MWNENTWFFSDRKKSELLDRGGKGRVWGWGVRGVGLGGGLRVYGEHSQQHRLTGNVVFFAWRAVPLVPL